MELDFAEDTVDILWVDNSNSEDSLVFKEAYRDNKNSPYTIVDWVNTNITTDASGAKLYNLPQTEVDRIERMLQGGCDTDVESDNESSSDDEDSDSLWTGSGWKGREGTGIEWSCAGERGSGGVAEPVDKDCMPPCCAPDSSATSNWSDPWLLTGLIDVSILPTRFDQNLHIISDMIDVFIKNMAILLTVSLPSNRF